MGRRALSVPGLLLGLAALLPACVSEEIGPQPPSWELTTDQPLVAVAGTPPEQPQQSQPAARADEPSILELIANDPATAEDLDATATPLDVSTEFHRLGRDVIRGLDGTWTKTYTMRSGKPTNVIKLLNAYVPDWPASEGVWNDETRPVTQRIKYTVINELHKDETVDKLGRREAVKGSIADVILLTAPPPVLLFVDELLTKSLADLPQIEVEILVVEVNLSDELDYDSKVKLARLANPDLPFDPLTNPTEGNFGAGIPINDGNGNEGLGSAFSSFPDGDISLPGFLLSLQGVHNNLKVDGILSLLQTIGASELLQTPKITVLNGHRASLTTGDRIPVFEAKGTVNNPTVSTSFEPTGVTIEMIPFILSEDLIRIDLSIDVSQQTGSAPFVLNGVDVSSPIISQRTAGTTLHVYSDQTFTLGGLKSTRQIETLTKVPLLGDIPILGWMFKSRQSTKQTTEILFFVRPSIKIPSQTLLDPAGS